MSRRTRHLRRPFEVDAPVSVKWYEGYTSEKLIELQDMYCGRAAQMKLTNVKTDPELLRRTKIVGIVLNKRGSTRDAHVVQQSLPNE